MGNKSSFRLHSQLTSFFSSSPEKSGSKCELSSTESGHSSKCDQSRGTKENGVDSESCAGQVYQHEVANRKAEPKSMNEIPKTEGMQKERAGDQPSPRKCGEMITSEKAGSDISEKHDKEPNTDPHHLDIDGGPSTNNYSDRIKRHQLEHERQMAELDRRQKEQQIELERRSKQQEIEMKQKSAEMKEKYERELQDAKLRAAQKMEETESLLAKKRLELEQSLCQSEVNHQKKMQEKEAELKKLNEKCIRTNLELDTRMKQQEMDYRKNAEVLDRDIKIAQKDLQLKIMEKESELKASLAEDEQKFQKELETKKIRIQREGDEAFQSRVTTDLEITQADGSKVTMRETKPGLVTEIAHQLISAQMGQRAVPSDEEGSQ